jgi:serine phosphatase RsbU (regulator of sigma subunit)
MPTLVIEKGARRGASFTLDGSAQVIGRSPDNAIALDDNHASRAHAAIQLVDGRYEVSDLGSSNGTFVNGEKIAGSRALSPGDTILVGHTTLVFDQARGSHVNVVSSTDSHRISLSSVPAGDMGTLLGFELDARTKVDVNDPNVRLKIIYHYADVMRRCFVDEELVSHLLDAVFTVLRPDRGAVLLKRKGVEALVPVASRTANAEQKPIEGHIRISSSILNKCLEERISVIVTDAMMDERFSASESVILKNICSAICTPLISGEELFGLLYVDTIDRFHQFSQAELDLITGIANQAAMALGNARRHEEALARRDVEMQLEVARRIHDKLLPNKELKTEVLLASGWNRQCSEVGGDYFGFFPTSTGHMFAIGDSTGHGVGAALIMSTARAYLVGALAEGCEEPRALMTRLNRLLHPDMERGLFVSFVILAVSETEGTLKYVSAGHEPPLLYRRSEDRFVELPVGGLVLGLLPEAPYEDSPVVRLQPDDRFCLFTDGILEQVNESGEEWGLKRLREAVRASSALAPKAAIDSIIGAVDRWRGGREQGDDLTIAIACWQAAHLADQTAGKTSPGHLPETRKVD